MDSGQNSFLITELAPSEVRRHLDRDPRLIIPVGACDQYGPHLPIGTCTLLAEAFACSISSSCEVLRAPAINYGVNVPTRSVLAGPASLREKTLHAMMNDLLAAWEDQGFAEFILLTVHGHDPHIEAIGTATVAGSRVRVVELLNMDLSTAIADPVIPEHGGEVVTSLMLHLYPERVDLARATDYLLDSSGRGGPRRIGCIPSASPGSIGRPSASNAETGRRLFDLIYTRIVDRVMRIED